MVIQCSKGKNLKYFQCDRYFALSVNRNVPKILQVKAKNIIHSRKYDVTKLDWLIRATKKENWSTLQDWFPWDLLSSSNSTSHRLAAIYDEYYDNYTCDADTESLQRSLTKAEEMVSLPIYFIRQIFSSGI